LWLHLGADATGTELAAYAARRGLAVSPGQHFAADRATLAHYLRLPFTATPEVLTQGSETTERARRRPVSAGGDRGNRGGCYQSRDATAQLSGSSGLRPRAALVGHRRTTSASSGCACCLTPQVEMNAILHDLQLRLQPEDGCTPGLDEDVRAVLRIKNL